MDIYFTPTYMTAIPKHQVDCWQRIDYFAELRKSIIDHQLFQLIGTDVLLTNQRFLFEENERTIPIPFFIKDTKKQAKMPEKSVSISSISSL